MSEAIKQYPLLKAGFKARRRLIYSTGGDVNLTRQYIVPVGVAWNITQPYVEQNYTQPTFDQCEHCLASPSPSPVCSTDPRFTTDISGQTTTGGTSPITGTTTDPPHNANQANNVAAVFIPIGGALFAAFIGATFML